MIHFNTTFKTKNLPYNLIHLGEKNVKVKSLLIYEEMAEKATILNI